MPKIKRMLLEQFRILHDEKFVRTFCRRCSWCGYVGWRTAADIEGHKRDEDIKIVVVVPFIGYDSKWPDQSRHRLKKLIRKRKRFHCYFTFCGCFQL